jgi:hypothetical protein
VQSNPKNIDTMIEKFYRLGSLYKKNAYKILPKFQYNSLENLDKNSPLISENKFYIDSGGKKYDLINFADGHNFAISEKFKRVLEESKITGWSCFPIEIEDIEDVYYGFQNLGQAGPILNLEALNNYETEIYAFDIDFWDKKDIFNFEKTLVNVCTQKVKEIIEKNKITNIELDLIS